MKNTKRIFVFNMALLLALTANVNLYASGNKTLFNKDWKFHLGNVANAEQPSYNDSKWRVLDLPHDWSIEPLPVQREGITIGAFSRMSEGGWDTGQTVGGEGWYRKEFTIPKEDTGKCFSLYFEGIYNQSEIWINGKKVYFNPNGYTSYKIDITEYCNAPDIPNIIAVKVVNAGLNSRWYTGSGIFRHVWLIKTEKLYLDEWDTFINASELNGKDAIVKFSTIVHNKTLQNITGNLDIKVFSQKRIEVFSLSKEIDISDKTTVSTSFTIKKPELWSVETPVLYTAEISITSNNKLFNKISIPFGIRTIVVSAEKGFLINGKTLKLKGGCIHHDNGLLGAVAIDRAEEKKVELMKANGFNAIRCAHNQVSEHFLNACDRLGMLVIHETFDQWQKPKRPHDYHQFFDEWSDSDLAASIRRDRNHPSIIMWSIANEIEQRADSIGLIIAQRLVKTIRKYDDSRFTTMGVNDFWDRRQFTWDNDSYRAFMNVDVAGYNYVWKKYESDHVAYPTRIMYGSESFPKEAAQNWNLVEKHSYIIGDFVWTAIDYLGEAGLAHTLELEQGQKNSQFMNWPWYNAWCGDIDFCGDKKPQSYYRDVLWKERAISMSVRPPVALGKKEVVNAWGWTDELLSWNWEGMEGKIMTVNVYSRSPKVRLFLNDKLIGEKEVNKENYTTTFNIAYKPGVLKAVNVGKSNESISLKTTGKPAAIHLTADRNVIKANKNDLSYVKIEITDEEGNVIPDVTFPVKIKCSGNGTVIASGNAAYDDMKSFRSLTPNTFRGKALAIIQPTEEKGTILLTVSTEGLPDAVISIETL